MFVREDNDDELQAVILIPFVSGGAELQGGNELHPQHHQG